MQPALVRHRHRRSLGLGEAWSEPGVNPKVAFVPTAWDFGTCSYTLQSGDTLDGLAQLYLGSPPGDYQGPGGSGGINLINQANLDNPLIAQGQQNLLQAGTVIHMPQAACTNALNMWQTQCQANASSVWQNNACLSCPPHSHANATDVTIGSQSYAAHSICLCDDGYVTDGKGGCMPQPPPSPSCTGGKILDANGNCVCPSGTIDNGMGGCDRIVVPVPPKKPQPTPVAEASIFGSPWFWLIGALATGGFIAASEYSERKKRKGSKRAG